MPSQRSTATSDFSVIEDGEFMVAQVEARSDRATEFLDAYIPKHGHDYTVVDSGRLIVPQAHLPELLAAAGERGLII